MVCVCGARQRGRPTPLPHALSTAAALRNPRVPPTAQVTRVYDRVEAMPSPSPPGAREAHYSRMN
eukprot:3015387-Prymnesium_polylepis.1